MSNSNNFLESETEQLPAKKAKFTMTHYQVTSE
jgi:hypothetical protein